MSIAWMNYVWEHSAQKGTSLLLLLAIADHANDDGICWPSVARLARKARTTKRHAQRLIAYLEEADEILVDRGDGRSNTSIYQIKGDIYAGKGDVQGRKGDICAAKKGDIERAKGDISAERVTSRARKGDIAMSPEPSIEPSLDPSIEPSADPDANASAQAEPAPAGSLAAAFREFHDQLKLEHANRAAILRRAYIHCYGPTDAPDHGRLGAFARTVGSWGTALDLIWTNTSRPPNGDILAYLESQHVARKRDRKVRHPPPLTAAERAIISGPLHAAPAAASQPRPDPADPWTTVLAELRAARPHDDQVALLQDSRLVPADTVDGITLYRILLSAPAADDYRTIDSRLGIVIRRTLSSILRKPILIEFAQEETDHAVP